MQLQNADAAADAARESGRCGTGRGGGVVVVAGELTQPAGRGIGIIAATAGSQYHGARCHSQLSTGGSKAHRAWQQSGKTQKAIATFTQEKPVVVADKNFYDTCKYLILTCC
eukprot:COSAG01_NODE_6531_length_3618_cov_1.658710_4_plen_112_part_00